jgi:hypothetical protein
VRWFWWQIKKEGLRVVGQERFVRREKDGDGQGGTCICMCEQGMRDCEYGIRDSEYGEGVCVVWTRKSWPRAALECENEKNNNRGGDGDASVSSPEDEE